MDADYAAMESDGSEVQGGAVSPILSPMVNQKLMAIERRGWMWQFWFEPDALLTTEGVWRIVSPEGVAICSEDHGHRFAGAEPFDALEAARGMACGRSVNEVYTKSQTSDLSLVLGGEFRLEVLVLSSGYESWSVRTTAGELICQEGGRQVVPNS